MYESRVSIGKKGSDSSITMPQNTATKWENLLSRWIILLEVDEWLLKRTVPSLHANFNQEIDLKCYNKVRELACVIDEFVRD